MSGNPSVRKILTLPTRRGETNTSAASNLVSLNSEVQLPAHVPCTKLTPKALGAWWPKNGVPDREWVIPHPKTGLNEFCYFPNMQAQGLTLAAGPTFLLFGKHWTRHKGYGYEHIIKEHWRELGYKQEPMLGYESLARVTDFVSKVLITGKDILCEHAQMRGNPRPLVVHGLVGTVWLDLFYKFGNAPYYSVVTAIPKKKGAGSMIGKVL